ncbi:MAG: aminodeoxychorismate synthase component I [Kordiimonadaceae bacterium]|nr:aminodeoxychorismate synthase component I [Kordiimonadaceae bacterium]MBO6569729.1 aminodeoxychorismate synthase component I [Kordiimonadaceae bacterium]MBO6966264.1 aminodeoxychorismate synthase component I [Kordiimonadaceae bacterium]
MLPADQTTPFILLDDSRAPGVAGGSLLFSNPESVICAHTVDDVPDAMAAIDDAYAAGKFVAGWIAYEAAAAFEQKVRDAIRHWPEGPLIWMMVCEACNSIDRTAVDEMIAEQTRHSESDIWFTEDNVTAAEYASHVATIKDYINAGDIYQANYTFPKNCQLAGDPLDLYRKLRVEQPVEFGAFIRTDTQTVLSFSPELFVRRSGNGLMARPMKGTAARFPNIVEDREAAIALSADEKTRAENLMIVDLLRNDLSRLARPGSVRVSDLFTIETYPTVHQMTSGIEAECRADLRPSEMMAALFPCGSVTGAPKIRAMEVIAEQEGAPRGVYCGAIGYFGPATSDQPIKWSFNVPIRTLMLNESGQGQFGVGSGIVADSVIESEFDECQLKSQFLENQSDKGFHLTETMRAENGRIELLEFHLDRMERSANRLSMPFERTAARSDALAACPQHRLARVRMCLTRFGELQITTSSLVEEENNDDTTLKVALAAQQLRSDNPSLRYKSSQRKLYDQASQRAAELGLADILFFNEHDMLVEGAISNVFVQLDGTLKTPPVSAGALPGVMRYSLLTQGNGDAVEASISRSDFMKAERVFLSNGLRGMREVQVIFDDLDLISSADS